MKTSEIGIFRTVNQRVSGSSPEGGAYKHLQNL